MDNIRFNLSPKQATALRQIQKHPWPIEAAQHKLQTTLGSLYKRGFVSVFEDFIEITEDGAEAIRLQAHSEIERGISTYSSPFARVIAELADWKARPEGEGAPRRKHRLIPIRTKRNAA